MRAIILIDALRQWKCPACGGTGRYTGYSKEALALGQERGNFDQPCKKCGPDHLNPIASAALTTFLDEALDDVHQQLERGRR